MWSRWNFHLPYDSDYWPYILLTSAASAGYKSRGRATKGTGAKGVRFDKKIYAGNKPLTSTATFYYPTDIARLNMTWFSTIFICIAKQKLFIWLRNGLCNINILLHICMHNNCFTSLIYLLYINIIIHTCTYNNCFISLFVNKRIYSRLQRSANVRFIESCLPRKTCRHIKLHLCSHNIFMCLFIMIVVYTDAYIFFNGTDI